MAKTEKKSKIATNAEVKEFLDKYGVFERNAAVSRLIEDYARSIANHARLTRGNQNLTFVTEKLRDFIKDLDEIRSQVDF